MLYVDGRLSDSLIRKKKELDDLRSPQSVLSSLNAVLGSEMISHSNAIDGNPLTLEETARIVREGVTIKGRSLKEHLEVRDHKRAVNYVNELNEDRGRPLAEKTVRELHRLVMRDTEGDRAGQYRVNNITPHGRWHRPPQAANVPREMKDLFSWYRDKQKYLGLVERVALFHHKLLEIHPFLSGNGKVARLFMALQLKREGYPLVVILRQDRKKYFDALKVADGGEYGPLVGFIMQAVNRSLDIYLKTLRPSSKKKEHFVPLAELSKQFPYSAKYLNLLVRQGKLEAHKDGRNWLSSKDAVHRYVVGRQRQR